MELIPIWAAVLFGCGAALLATPIFWFVYRKRTGTNLSFPRVLVYYVVFAVTASLVRYVFPILSGIA